MYGHSLINDMFCMTCRQTFAHHDRVHCAIQHCLSGANICNRCLLTAAELPYSHVANKFWIDGVKAAANDRCDTFVVFQLDYTTHPTIVCKNCYDRVYAKHCIAQNVGPLHVLPRIAQGQHNDSTLRRLQNERKRLADQQLATIEIVWQ